MRIEGVQKQQLVNNEWKRMGLFWEEKKLILFNEFDMDIWFK